MNPSMMGALKGRHEFIKIQHLSPAKAGFGIEGGHDPRVTLAALAHPGLLHVAASRLGDADKPASFIVTRQAQPNKALQLTAR